MSPYGTDVIMFHARNPCGRLGRRARGKNAAAPTSPLTLSPHHMCLLEGMIYTSSALRRIQRNTMLTTQSWKGQAEDWGSLGVLLSVTDVQWVETASPAPLGSHLMKRSLIMWAQQSYGVIIIAAREWATNLWRRPLSQALCWRRLEATVLPRIIFIPTWYLAEAPLTTSHETLNID